MVDGNSFAGAIELKSIRKPNLSVEITFKEVRKAVDLASNGGQIPWDSSSLRGEFFFNIDKSAKSESPAIAITEKGNTKDESKGSAYHPLGIRGAEKFNKGDFDGAISDLQNAIDLDPDRAAGYKAALSQTFSRRSVSRYHQGNLQGALADANKAIDVAPTPDGGIHNFRGAVLVELKRFDEALRDFDKSIEISPNATAYANRGDLYKRRGDKKKADSDYERARALDTTVSTPGSKPENNPAVISMVNALVKSSNANMNAGRLDTAISELTQAINLMPKNASLFLLRGNAKLLRGFIGGFVTDYPTAAQLGASKINDLIFKVVYAETSLVIDNEPQNVDALLNRSLILASHGKCNETLKDINAALAIAPQSYTAQLFRFMFLSGENPNERDIANLSRVIESNPKSAFAYFVRALAYGLRGKKKEAEADMNTVISLTEEDGAVVVLTKIIVTQEVNRMVALDRFKCFK